MEVKPETQVPSEGKPFIDPTSGRTFRKFKYFDFEVIQDVETGWVNSGKFLSKLDADRKHKRDMNDFKCSWAFYQNALDIGKKLILSKEGFPALSGNPEHMKSIEISNINELLTSDIERAIFVRCHKGFDNELRGTYVPFRIFQIIAIWADKNTSLLS